MDKSELEIVREELVKSSIEDVAKKIDRTPKAIRNMLRRNRLSVREIRCDLFSVESLASALHVRKAEVVSGLSRNGFKLQSRIKESGVSTSLRPKLSRAFTGTTTRIS